MSVSGLRGGRLILTGVDSKYILCEALIFVSGHRYELESGRTEEEVCL